MSADTGKTINDLFRYFCKALGNNEISSRKTDHIELAFEAQAKQHDNRFYYEPLLSGHTPENPIGALQLAGKIMQYPIWISSMTGGTTHAADINKNLATACRIYGLGMGLGSCRPVLLDKSVLPDFAVRKYIGEQPLYANLGIAQIEQLLYSGNSSKITELVDMLEADGLIVHLNPLQEWMQPEGDKIEHSPLMTIQKLLDVFKGSVMVKEVGQGMGPESLKALMQLPLESIEFGAYGGTNFSLLEALRGDEFRKEQYTCVANVGHTANEMVDYVNEILNTNGFQMKTRSLIVSGGIQSFLDGYYYISKLQWKSMYAQASAFLKYALKGEQELLEYTEAQIKGLALASSYLKVK